MEVLFGFAGLGAEARADTLRRLARRLDQRGLNLSESLLGEEFAFLVAAKEIPSPCSRVADGGRSALAWIGHAVDERFDLFPSAQALLGALEGRGAPALGALDGLHAIALYDKEEKVLRVSGGALGLWPLFYRAEGGGVLFSTSMDLLITCSPQPVHFSPLGAAAFFCIGFGLGDDTLAEEIKRHPQGKVLRYDGRAKRLSFETVLRLSDIPEPRVAAEEEALERLVPAIERAVGRRLRHSRPVVCCLSGGFDSRTICANLDRLGAAFQTLTTESDLPYGHTEFCKSDDLDGSRLVAEALGVANACVPLPPDYLERFWREKCVATSFASTMHTWIIPLARGHNLPGAVSFDGLGGEALLRGEHGAIAEALESGDDARLVEEYAGIFPVLPAAPSILSPPIGERWAAQAKGALTRVFDGHRGRLNRVHLCDLSTLCRRSASHPPCDLLAERLHPVAPFADREVLSIALDIRTDLKADGRLYRALIRRINPALAAIPSSNDWIWPEDFPRRLRRRLCARSPRSILTYLEEVEKTAAEISGFIRPEWIARAKAAAFESDLARQQVLPQVQAAGEICYWLNLYRDRIVMPSARDLA